MRNSQGRSGGTPASTFRVPSSSFLSSQAWPGALAVQTDLHGSSGGRGARLHPDDDPAPRKDALAMRNHPAGPGVGDLMLWTRLRHRFRAAFTSLPLECLAVAITVAGLWWMVASHDSKVAQGMFFSGM